jgi:hypothetical protein
MKLPVLMPVAGVLGVVSVALAFATGAPQVALAELTAGSLTTSGRRVRYLQRLARAGPLGRHRARRRARQWYSRSSGFSTLYLCFDRSLWRGCSRDEMRGAVGQPWRTGPDYDIWFYPEECPGDPRTYLAVEYDGDTYAGMGSPGATRSSADSTDDGEYRLQRTYDIDRAASDPGG